MKERYQALIKTITDGIEGGARGLIAGYIVALLYILAIVILGIFCSFIDTPRCNGDISIIPIILAIGVFMAIVLAAPFGMITGFIIGVAVSAFADRLSNVKAMSFGLIFGMTVSLSAFLLLRHLGDGYWLLIGLPSIPYIVTYGWMSMKFYENWVLELTQQTK